MENKHLVIDGPYLAHKSYCAPYKLTTSTGLDSTMLHQFFRSLKSIHSKVKPDDIYIAWESHGTKSWRKEKYPSYKKNRSTVLRTEFWDYLSDVQLLCYFLGIKQFYSSGNEADDVIGRIVKSIKGEHIIYTVDKDIMQLIDDGRVSLYDGKKSYHAVDVLNKFSVLPKQIPDLLAIWGDVSDNIEGIKGYGMRHSSKLLEKYGRVEDIPMSESISKYRERILLNKSLTKLNCDCCLLPVPSNNFETSETLETLLDKYELKVIKRDIEEYKELGK